MPNKEAVHIYGVHDWSQEWAALVKSAGKTAWCVITLEIGDDPNDLSGQDFSHIADQAITVIGRLNYSHHGKGTIPTKDRYDEFAIRCANFVRASKGCFHWVVGNEPNLNGETPGVKIMPDDYALCFKQCRSAIKQTSVEHQVITAAVAPYNTDNGDWISYWFDMLSAVYVGGGADGVGMHTYSRGGGPASITSKDKMNEPYNAYYNGFLAYKDFLAYVPVSMRSVPVYITETDQNGPWEDRNSGWVEASYGQINSHNLSSGTQKIKCLVLYRWSTDDKWNFSQKRGVVEDFVNTLRSTNYLVPTKPAIPAVPAPLPVLTAPWVRVTAPAGANIRSGPSTALSAITAVVSGTNLKAIGRTSDFIWYQVNGPFGLGWVHSSLLQLPTGLNVPVVPLTVPAIPSPSAPQVLGKDWLVSSWSRVLGIDEKVVRAVLVVESGGHGFEGNRMVIRLENHRFHHWVKLLAPALEGKVLSHFRYGSPIWTEHYWRRNPQGEWQRQHDGGQAEEWDSFQVANTIHEKAAMLSISMGSAQILGENYKVVGYSTVGAMFDDYNTVGIGEYNQLTGFFAYAYNVAGLLQSFREKNWERIAASYNGTANVPYYSNALRTKYMELGGR